MRHSGYESREGVEIAERLERSSSAVRCAACNWNCFLWVRAGGKVTNEQDLNKLQRDGEKLPEGHDDLARGERCKSGRRKDDEESRYKVGDGKSNGPRSRLGGIDKQIACCVIAGTGAGEQASRRGEKVKTEIERKSSAIGEGLGNKPEHGRAMRIGEELRSVQPNPH